MPFHASRLSYFLSAKLVSGFLLVTMPSLSVMVATSLYALRDLTSVNQQLQEISRSLEAVQGLETAVARAVTPLSAYLVDGAPEEARRFEAVIDEVDARLKGCGGAVFREFSRQIPLVSCDLVRMEQVLANVFVNAVQAMPQGGPDGQNRTSGGLCGNSSRGHRSGHSG